MALLTGGTHGAMLTMGSSASKLHLAVPVRASSVPRPTGYASARTPQGIPALPPKGRKSTTVQVAAGCKTRAVEVTITCYERVPISKARVRDEDTAASQQCNTVSDKACKPHDTKQPPSPRGQSLLSPEQFQWLTHKLCEPENMYPVTGRVVNGGWASIHRDFCDHFGVNVSKDSFRIAYYKAREREQEATVRACSKAPCDEDLNIPIGVVCKWESQDTAQQRSQGPQYCFKLHNTNIMIGPYKSEEVALGKYEQSKEVMMQLCRSNSVPQVHGALTQVRAWRATDRKLYNGIVSAIRDLVPATTAENLFADFMATIYPDLDSMRLHEAPLAVTDPHVARLRDGTIVRLDQYNNQSVVLDPKQGATLTLNTQGLTVSDETTADVVFKWESEDTAQERAERPLYGFRLYNTHIAIGPYKSCKEAYDKYLQSKEIVVQLCWKTFVPQVYDALPLIRAWKESDSKLYKGVINGIRDLVPVEDAVRLLRIMWVLLYDDSFDWALNEARRGLRPIEVKPSRSKHRTCFAKLPGNKVVTVDKHGAVRIVHSPEGPSKTTEGPCEGVTTVHYAGVYGTRCRTSCGTLEEAQKEYFQSKGMLAGLNSNNVVSRMSTEVMKVLTCWRDTSGKRFKAVQEAWRKKAPGALAAQSVLSFLYEVYPNDIDYINQAIGASAQQARPHGLPGPGEEARMAASLTTIKQAHVVPFPRREPSHVPALNAATATQEREEGEARRATEGDAWLLRKARQDLSRLYSGGVPTTGH